MLTELNDGDGDAAWPGTVSGRASRRLCAKLQPRAGPRYRTRLMAARGTQTGSPPFGLDVVDVRTLTLADRLHDLADVDAVLDHRIAGRHVIQRDLVSDRDVLAALECDGSILVEDQSGERRPGMDALDDDDRNAVIGVVQYAMDHGGSWQLARRRPGAVG